MTDTQFKFYYCPDCNMVYEIRNAERQCFHPDHSIKAKITDRQYGRWEAQGQPQLDIAKIGKEVEQPTR